MNKTFATNTNFLPCPFTGNSEGIGGSKGKAKGCRFALPKFSIFNFQLSIITILFLMVSMVIQAQNVNQLFKEGKALYEAKNYDQAFPKLKVAAEKGHKKAQYRLGRCYEKGRGVAKDEALAFQWYTKSALKEYPKGQYALGMCYKDGIGTAKDPKKAAEYFAKAAQGDNADAQYQLGKCYMKGKGITADQKKAASWFKKAIANEKGGKDILAKIRKKASEGDDNAKAILKLTGVK